MAGKELVAAVENRVEKRRSLLRIDRRWRHVSDRHEHGADQQEQRHGLERERHAIWAPGQQAQRNNKGCKSAVDKQESKIVRSNPTQHKIGDVIAGVNRGIGDRGENRDGARSKERYTFAY